MYIPHSYLKAAILACEQAPGKGEKIGKSSTPDSSTCQILFFFFTVKPNQEPVHKLLQYMLGITKWFQEELWPRPNTSDGTMRT